MTKAQLLIVAGDHTLATALARTVAGLGYDVLGIVASGEEALALLGEHPADLVLMDARLAGQLSGAATAGSIRQTSRIPVLLLTDTPTDPPPSGETDLPCTFLVKLVSESALAATVAMALQCGTLARQLQASRQALEHSEQRRRLYLASTPYGVFTFDPQGKILQVNRSGCLITGYPKQELLTMDIGDLVLQDERAGIKALFRGAIEHDRSRGELSFRRKDGEHRWMVLTVVSLGNARFFGFCNDITERRKAEEAQRATLERTYTILSNLHSGILLIGPENRVEFVNQSFCDLFDIDEPASGLIGQTETIVAAKIADTFADPAGAIARMGDIVALGHPIRNEQVALRGGKTYLRDFIPIGGEGEHIARLWHYADITEQKRAEEALEKRMVALIQPLDSMDEIAIEELFDLQVLQRIQDEFAEATGVASIITHTDGRPITAPSNFCRLCSDIIRQTEIGLANCIRSDTLVGMDCLKSPTVQPCLSGGFLNGGAGITVGGRHIANWLIGQVRDETQTEEAMRAYARRIGADEEQCIEAFREVPIMSRQRFEKIAKALFTLTTQLSVSAYQNMQQARFITERWRAERALQESRERLHSLFRVAPTGIGIVRERVFVEVNKQVCAMTGYLAEELVGRSARLVYPDQEEFDFVGKEKYRQMKFGGSGVVETRWLRKDGVTIDVLLASTPLDEADPAKGTIFTALDITERKRTEALLRDSEARYRELVESANSIIIRMDSEGRLSFLNEYAQRFFGYRADEVIGKNAAGTIVPEVDSSGKDLRTMIADIGRRPELYATNENENIRRDGTRVWISWTNKPFYNEAGEVTEILCVGNDMTERKRAEEEKRQLQTQLLHAQKMEAIGTLAGGIAHDFNNILAAVIGYADMARENAADGTDLAKSLDQILKAGHRAKDLVKQILAFSRQSENESKILFPSIIVKEVIKLLRPSLPTTISIEHQIDSQAGPVHIDPTQLHQILMNLCTNAFHAMEQTGGQLFLSLNKVRFAADNLPNAALARPGNFVELAVSDTGTGIPEDIRHRIFDPFFTTKNPGKGTGMGLSIVHGIVAGANGFVVLDSTPGKGSTFRVYLPEAERETLTEDTAVEAECRGDEHILFVDDEEVLADMAKTMLERLGYRVTVRSNGLDALTTFQNHPDLYDLVITDQTMPGMTGMDLARRLLMLRPDLPIVLCTGYSTLISQEEAQAQGIRAFALKPLTKKELAIMIKKVLNRP